MVEKKNLTEYEKSYLERKEKMCKFNNAKFKGINLDNSFNHLDFRVSDLIISRECAE